MKKELTIAAKFDTSDFDKSVESMQKKLREMYAPSDSYRMQRTSEALQSGGFGALAGAPGSDNMKKKVDEYKKNMDKMIREEKTNLEDKIKTLSKQEAAYAKINEQYQKVIKAGKEDLKIKEDLKNAQEALSKAKQEELDSEGKINALLKEKQKFSIGGGFKEGFANGGGMLGGMKGALGAMGISPMVAGAIGAAAGIAIKAVSDTFRRPVNMSEMQGSAVAGTTGNMLAQMQSGDMAYEGMYGDERARAAGNARSARNRSQFGDVATLLGTLGLSTLFSEKQRAMVFDNDKYDAMQNKQFSEDFNTSLEGEKSSSAYKKDAIERLRRGGMRDLATERMLGIGDSGYLGAGGYLQNSFAAGFGEDQITGASQGIMGAGGSTDMGRNALSALKAQRGLGLTNASPLLGALSGSMGGAEQSKQALIDIFATGQQIGLDKSKFAEENRKFMQSVADVVSSGSMTSRFGAGQVADTMGNFATGATTMKGLENARAAYEASQNASTATSGYTGAINSAVMMRQFPDLIKMTGRDPALMQDMMSMKQNELDPNSPTMKSMLSKYNTANGTNISGEDFVKRIGEMHSAQSERYAPGSSGMMKGLSQDMLDYAKNHGGSMQGYSPTGEAGENFSALAARSKQVPELSGLNRAQMEQYLLGQAAGQAQYLPGGKDMKDTMDRYKRDIGNQAGTSMENNDTGRAMDKVLASSAQDASTAVRTLASSIDELARAAGNASGKRQNNESASREAADFESAAKNRSWSDRYLSMGADEVSAAQNTARKIQENIHAGEDQFKGIGLHDKNNYINELKAFQATKQTQATSGGNK